MKITNKSTSTLLAFSLLLLAFGFVAPSTALAATDPGLGAAAGFSILANTAITNVPTSVISGDVGLNNAGTNITGLTSAEVAGTIFDTNGTGPDGAGAILPPAVQANASTANGNISGQGATASIGPALDALTVVPGVYDIGAGRLNGGVLHLNGPGVYIFRASSDFVSSGSISMENGARACDVFWQVNTLATINGSSFAGTIIAGTGIHFGANVSLDGRALAIGGDVTLISDTISGPSCATPPTPPGGGGGGGGGSSVPTLPIIDVLKVPNPSSLPNGPGSVTYTYTVRNVGTLPMTPVTMLDDSCSPITLQSGDANTNGALDLTETWVYTCNTTLTATHTNTVTATGFASGFSSTDTSSATVVVGAPTVPPAVAGIPLPAAGFGPQAQGSVAWEFFIPIGILFGLFSLYLISRKIQSQKKL